MVLPDLILTEQYFIAPAFKTLGSPFLVCLERREFPSRLSFNQEARQSASFHHRHAVAGPPRSTSVPICGHAWTLLLDGRICERF